MYLKTDLPEQFHEGYKLSDQIDKKLQKGNYLPRENDADKVATIEQKQIEELPLEIPTNQIVPEISKSKSETENDYMTKATRDFKKSQKYNDEHKNIVIIYKLVRVFFWIGFWVGLV